MVDTNWHSIRYVVPNDIGHAFASGNINSTSLVYSRTFLLPLSVSALSACVVVALFILKLRELKKREPGEWFQVNVFSVCQHAMPKRMVVYSRNMRKRKTLLLRERAAMMVTAHAFVKAHLLLQHTHTHARESTFFVWLEEREVYIWDTIGANEWMQSCRTCSHRAHIINSIQRTDSFYAEYRIFLSFLFMDVFVFIPYVAVSAPPPILPSPASVRYFKGVFSSKISNRSHDFGPL